MSETPAQIEHVHVASLPWERFRELLDAEQAEAHPFRSRAGGASLPRPDETARPRSRRTEQLGDAKVQNANDLVAAIAAHHTGDKVAITVERSSNTVQLTVTLGTQLAQSSTGGSCYC